MRCNVILERHQKTIDEKNTRRKINIHTKIVLAL